MCGRCADHAAFWAAEVRVTLCLCLARSWLEIRDRLAPPPWPNLLFKVAEYRYEIERLAKELGELKKRWFDAKRREQQQQQHQQRSSGGGGGTGAQKQQQSGGAAGPAGGGSRDGGLGVAAAGQAVKGGGAAVV